jgi:hypothetical protein
MLPGLMRSAACGFLVWGLIALGAVAGRTSLDAIAALFLLSPLVLVPLGFEVTQPLPAESTPAGRWARILLPVGAVLATASFWLSAGPTAGLVASGWSFVCLLAAIDGLWRLVRGGLRSVEGVCASAGVVYLLVGSVWLILSRSGSTPFHYPRRTVLLAAVHFSFTGFVLPIVAGATAKARRTAPGPAVPALGSWLVVAGILAGPALLAAGNVKQSPTLKLVGALLLVAASFGLAGQVASVMRRRCITSRRARALVAISTLSLVLGMLLVAVYAIGDAMGHAWLTVPQMGRAHGGINALGFALCGLLGWALETRGSPFLDSSVAPSPAA